MMGISASFSMGFAIIMVKLSGNNNFIINLLAKSLLFSHIITYIHEPNFLIFKNKRELIIPIHRQRNYNLLTYVPLHVSTLIGSSLGIVISAF
jgi:hypothetical protein